MKKLLIIITLILLSGCLDYEQIATVKNDKSGKMFIHYWMKIDLPADSTFIEKLGIFDEHHVREKYSSKVTEINNLEFYIDSNDSTIHSKVEFQFTNFDSLSQTLAFKDSKLAIIDQPGGLKLFSQQNPPISFSFVGEELENNFTYVYYLPGTIFSSNADDVTLNKLTWTFNAEQIKLGTNLSATFRPFRLAETPEWIYWLSLIVLLIVISYLFKKRVN